MACGAPDVRGFARAPAASSAGFARPLRVRYTEQLILELAHASLQFSNTPKSDGERAAELDVEW